MKLLEIIKNTFKSVITNYQTVLKISSIWSLIIIIEALTGFSSFCVINDTCTESSGLFSSLLFSISGVVIICSYIKADILNSQSKYWQLSFGKKELKFIGFSLLFLLSIVVASIITIVVIDLFFALLNANSVQLTSFLFVIVPISFGVFFSRLYVKFAAIALGDTQTTTKQAFALTKGNACKLFFGQVLIVIPVLITYALLVVIFTLIESENILAKIIFSVFVMALSFIDSAIKGSYYAQVYKNFVTVVKKETVEETKKTVAKIKSPAKKTETKKVVKKKTTTKK